MNKILSVLILLLKAITILSISLYIAAISFVPAVEFAFTLNIWLLLWFSLGVACLILVWLLLYRFTARIVLASLLGLALWHLGLYYLPPVRLAFEIDSCLDSGGAWRNNACQTQELED